jgi:hypothetical protein
MTYLDLTYVRELLGRAAAFLYMDPPGEGSDYANLHDEICEWLRTHPADECTVCEGSGSVENDCVLGRYVACPRCNTET